MHYAGTIVVTPNTQDKRGHKVFDLVDGQQRITTLILLLSVICRELRKSGREIESEIYRKFIKAGDIGNAVFKLQLGKDLSQYFGSLVEKGLAGASNESAPYKSKSHQNLRDAVEECQNWLKDQDVDAVLQCVCEKLGFLVYAPEKTNEIGIMFEVINNRGKPLSELEKIKNYLIYFSEKNEKEEIMKKVEDSWSEILRNLSKANCTSNEEENSFLRNCWIVFWDPDKARSHHVYDNLKQECPPDKPTNENVGYMLKFIDFLKDASTDYARYQTRTGVPDEDEISWLERISCHPADASITPLILAISARANGQKDRNDLLELLEKLNFRYYGTGIAKKSDAGQGHLFKLAYRFFNDFEWDSEGERIDVRWLKGKLEKFIHEHADDRKFIECLTLDKDGDQDYYHWKGLKYFLASYERELQKEQGKSINFPKIMASRNPETPNDFFHKEHILAQAYNQLDDVKNSKDANKLSLNKRRLGNFMLLNEGLNIKVGNEPPEKKIKSYFNVEENTPNTLMIHELPKFFDKAQVNEDETGWTNKTKKYWINVYTRFFDIREEKMINFALKRWRVPKLDDNIAKVSLDSLGDDDNNKIYTPLPFNMASTEE